MPFRASSTPAEGLDAAPSSENQALTWIKAMSRLIRIVFSIETRPEPARAMSF
jgi:hypothetical protein